jgi:hypothetical protein
LNVNLESGRKCLNLNLKIWRIVEFEYREMLKLIFFEKLKVEFENLENVKFEFREKWVQPD